MTWVLFNEVASNDLEIVCFWEILPPDRERSCGRLDFYILYMNNFTRRDGWKSTYMYLLFCNLKCVLAIPATSNFLVCTKKCTLLKRNTYSLGESQTLEWSKKEKKKKKKQKSYRYCWTCPSRKITSSSLESIFSLFSLLSIHVYTNWKLLF